jgi:hypothetical protein
VWRLVGQSLLETLRHSLSRHRTSAVSDLPSPELPHIKGPGIVPIKHASVTEGQGLVLIEAPFFPQHNTHVLRLPKVRSGLGRANDLDRLLQTE